MPTLVFVFSVVGLTAIHSLYPKYTQGKRNYRVDIVGLMFYLVCFKALYALFERPENISISALETLPFWAQMLLFFLIKDFLFYLGHRAVHTKVLWCTHEFHHLPAHINPISGFGMPLPQVMLAIATLIIPFTIIPFESPTTAFQIYACVGVFNNCFIHSNVAIPGARWLELIFVTPRVHSVHHARNPSIGNANFSAYFTFYDRIFRTYKSPDSLDDFEIGSKATATPFAASILGVPWRASQESTVG